jgi:lysophospholipase L1-like esterase
VYEIHPRAAEIFFAKATPDGTELVGSHRRDLVVLPKPADVFRVVFVGASTVEGFPMPRNLTGTRYLEAMLQHLVPGRRVEVINLGVTAVASFPIRTLGIEALEQLSPDLLLIYEAHNEFFGASGVASFQYMGQSVAAMQAVYLVRQLALVQAAEALRTGLRPRGAGRRPELIRIMAAADQIPPGGALHAAARRSLETNFRALLRAARARGVPVVLATVASNERDVAPMSSSMEDLAAPRRAQWGRRLAAAERAPATAETARLVAEAPHHAGAAYAHARALEAAGRGAEAVEMYRRARDLDAMPWRAGRDKNRLLRRLAAEEGVALADCEASFAAASRATGGATGWDLFADHLHPSLKGQALLARTFLDAIVRRRLLPVAPRLLAARLATLPDWREISARLGADPLERFLLAHKMAALFRVPPIGRNNQAAAVRLAGLVRRIRATSDPVDRLAIQLWERGSGEAGFALPISYFGGVAALRSGQHERAAVYLHAAAENAFPLSDERCAAELLAVVNAIAGGADPTGVRRQLAAARTEAEEVATLPSQSTTLLARTLADLSVLGGDFTGAGRYAAGEAGAGATPWERAFLREVPRPRDLAALAAAVPPQPALATGVPPQPALATGVLSQPALATGVLSKAALRAVIPLAVALRTARR